MAIVFFSYSHADEALRDRLEKALVMLKRQGTIETFHDRRIPPGDVVDDAISAELERANVILLLISPDFLASQYCYGVETTRALERSRSGEARVIPIILRPCEWQHTPIRALIALPTDGKPVTRFTDQDDAFLDISTGIRAALEALEKRPVVSSSGASVPTSVQTAIRPRSSNLHLRKSFTDIEKARFRDDAFHFIANFFENSVDELAARNPSVQGIFTRIDAQQFTAQLYLNGKKRSACRIFTGQTSFDNGIAFSFDENSRGSLNESLSVIADEDGLFLKSIGMANYGRDKQRLTFEGGAEMYWAMLIEPLQR